MVGKKLKFIGKNQKKKKFKCANLKNGGKKMKLHTGGKFEKIAGKIKNTKLGQDIQKKSKFQILTKNSKKT